MPFGKTVVVSRRRWWEPRAKEAGKGDGVSNGQGSTRGTVGAIGRSQLSAFHARLSGQGLSKALDGSVPSADVR